MTEQIEVFGQFDVRRNLEDLNSETGSTGQMTMDKTRITNTFGGDQLNAALDAVKNKRKYVRGYKNQSKNFISAEKILL